MAKDTPSARTKRLFEAQGYIVGNAEHLNPWVGPPDKKCLSCGKNRIGIKQDLWGFADHIMFHPQQHGVILVQSTSGSNHAARRDKILANEKAKDWVRKPERYIAVASWSRVTKKNKDGKTSKVKPWKERIEFLGWGDF